jgi:transposase
MIWRFHNLLEGVINNGTAVRICIISFRCKNNTRQLCRRYNISAKTGYKWINRYKEFGLDGLIDQSRIPKSSSKKTSGFIEALILKERDAIGWCSSKLKAALERDNKKKFPASSTITRVLNRNGKLEDEKASIASYECFAIATPNELWQMDFKGHFSSLSPIYNS